MFGARTLLAIPLLFALSGCEFLQPKVETDWLEAELIKWLADQGMTATEAKCPEGQKLEKGNRLECTCMVGGVEIPISVEVLDPIDHSVSWEPKYTTVTKEQLVESIHGLPEFVGHPVEIVCKQPVFVSVPNSKVVCDLTDTSNGGLFVINLEFTDGEGSYKLDVVPKPAG